MEDVKLKRGKHKRRSVEDRLWSRVDKNGPTVRGIGTPCWIWKGGKNAPNGYGQISYRGKVTGTHRVSLILSGVGVPDDALVLHRCDVRTCVNPDHLFVGTVQDNSDDKVAKGRHVYFQGGARGMAKLNDESVREIRRLYAGGGWTVVALGERFGVSFSSISRVILRRNWAHVKDEAAA